MKKISMISCLILIVLMMQPVSADIDNYQFDIFEGNNTLDFETSYDGNYVNSISGMFYETGNNYFSQDIIINTSEHIGTKRTLKFDISYRSGMFPNFADVFFTYQNGTEIPCFKGSVISGEQATFYLYFESIEPINNIYLCWGDGVEREQNAYVFFAKYEGNETYAANTSFNVRSSDSLYGGANTTVGLYTNADVRFSTTGSGSGSSNAPSILFSAVDNSTIVTSGSWYNTVCLWVESGSLFSTVGQWNNTTINTTSNVTTLNISKNGTSVVMKITGSDGTVFNQNNSSTAIQKPAMFHFYRGGSSTFTLYSAYFYNSSNFTVNFGEIHVPVFDDPYPVEIQYPKQSFKKLDYFSSVSGMLNLDIDYKPHAVMSTPSEATFEENVILQFDVSPHNLSIDYQIALDDGFYSVVNSGSSTGNISTSLPAGQYYWRLMQPDGIYTETRNFTVVDAQPIAGHLNFVIKDELTNANISAIVILSNNTTTLQKTGANVIFNSTEVIAGNYTIQIKQNNYSTRYYEVESPGNYTLYILPTNLTTNNASVVYFSLIDNTNTFQYDSTKLEIIKPTPNGSVLIQNSYFDASGFVVATLNQFDNYILKVVSDSGHERILGNYIQAGQTTTQLVISEIDLKDSNMSVHGGFRYNITKSDETIKFDWLNPNDSLKEPLLFQIYKNNELVMNISTGAPFGSINYYDNVAGEMKLDPDATYRIFVTAKTVNGTIKINEYYKVGEESVGIDFEKIPLALRIVISLILLILVASMFNITNAKFASIVVSFIALFLAGLIGFLPISVGLLVWMLFISVVAFKTNR